MTTSDSTPNSAAALDTMRRCSMCRLMKPLSEFPIKDRARGLRRSYCWDCCRAYSRAHYQRNREAYLERTRNRHRRDRDECRRVAYEYLLAHPCVDCGEADPVVLDFDHRDRTTKVAEVAWFIRRGDVNALRLEIAKCDVRCANCHRQKTARQLRYSRWLALDR